MEEAQNQMRLYLSKEIQNHKVQLRDNQLKLLDNLHQNQVKRPSKPKKSKSKGKYKKRLKKGEWSSKLGKETQMDSIVNADRTPEKLEEGMLIESEEEVKMEN